MPDIKEVIDQGKILDILARTKKHDSAKVLEILDKAKKRKGLTPEEAAFLVQAEETGLIEKMFKVAGAIKKEIYGERLVLFAPLYVSNFCVNDCQYCAFHRSNPACRKKLSLLEVSEEVKILENMGHKRLLLEFGEHAQKNPIDYVVRVIKTIYKTKTGRGEIRRVNVNIAADTVENYRKLKEAGIGTYQLFQETYHRPTYEKLHSGPKADFARQLFAHNRALEAGIDDIGLGALFGLYDWRFEILALVSHAKYLEKKFGVGPHTFSVPRFQPAGGVDFQPEYSVSEDELLKIIAILRMAVPYTGMIISTRERPEIRKRAFEIGISQTSAGSRTEVGGYQRKLKIPAQGWSASGRKSEELKVSGQFQLQDERSLDKVVESILRQGLLPSFCTACYRSKRTGKNFMSLAKPGNIHNFCRPNALLTFKEYLEDFGSERIKNIGVKIMNKYLNQIPDSRIKNQTKIKLSKIENGERDLYF